MPIAHEAPEVEGAEVLAVWVEPLLAVETLPLEDELETVEVGRSQLSYDPGSKLRALQMLPV